MISLNSNSCSAARMPRDLIPLINNPLLVHLVPRIPFPQLPVNLNPGTNLKIITGWSGILMLMLSWKRTGSMRAGSSRWKPWPESTGVRWCWTLPMSLAPIRRPWNSSLRRPSCGLCCLASSKPPPERCTWGRTRRIHKPSSASWMLSTTSLWRLSIQLRIFWRKSMILTSKSGIKPMSPSWSIGPSSWIGT